MLRESLGRVAAGHSLSHEEAGRTMAAIMSGEASDAQIGAFLTALKMKGETSEEIAGFAGVMRDFVVAVGASGGDVLDTCGTGGDGRGTFNISTAVALVVAGAGVTVAKHGNHGISSACGSADVLAALGVRVDLPPAAAAAALDTLGISFLYAPLYHPAMRHVAKSRRELGFRTVFNLLGPLTNPAGAARQLIGVYDPALTDKVAEVLLRLGTKRAMVVHSLDGLDEISAAAPTKIAEVVNGQVKSYLLDPADYGFRGDSSLYRGGAPDDNAAIILGILRGQKDGRRDIVLLNAAAALVVAGKAGSLREGLALAAASVDSGAALGRLEALRRFGADYREGLPLS
ncbi:anthranilate phosphoribosyltransferase [Anaeroselena agilis]|uniref:Anthranilate phosphoribosyltransferase n=1 Tax=Anaeroselena agilis TaxID=3063788 RepID=A0ABU3P2Y2_9FIRM|nr:anthranilate phosphoribosyltransferase [Selenomonadales bacterium 4137-cl]